MKLTTRNLTLPAAFIQVLGRKSTFAKLGATLLYLFMMLFLTTDVLARTTCPADQGVPADVRICGNPEFKSCSIDIDGIPRHFCMHVPELPTEDVPLVLGFHGSGGMASRAVNWLDKHTEQGMILVAPSALHSGTSCTPRWRTLSGSSGPNAIPDWAALRNLDTCMKDFDDWTAESSNAQDLEFIRRLINELDSSFNIDQRFAVGFSSGAGMVMQLMITDPFASALDGFAMVANGINDAQAAAAIGAGSEGPFSAVGPETRSPAMLIWGTADKTQMPFAKLAAVADALAIIGPPKAQNCTAPLDTPAKTFQCLMSNAMDPELTKHTFISRIEETQDWLVEFNGAETRPIEGLYPDLGHGQVSGPEDDTMTVRRDFQAGADGQAVTVLTIIDGRHVFPGPKGNEPPCANASCDIDAMEEILHFWRANAGLSNIWQ